jgi:hypothetical protein
MARNDIEYTAMAAGKANTDDDPAFNYHVLVTTGHPLPDRAVSGGANHHPAPAAARPAKPEKPPPPGDTAFQRRGRDSNPR